MPRSRSRSPRRDFRGGGGDYNRDNNRDEKGVAEAAKGGSSEQEIVSVAIRQLPPDIRERLGKLFEEGLLKEGDLDLRSITVFASLNEGLQARVMNHMEGERIYVANARSKSGFLIATCDKAKTGCLDARGLGAIDPWRTALVAMATPKQKLIDLKPERDWLDQHDEDAVIKIKVSLGSSVEAELGVPSVTVELPLTECHAAIKAKLVAMGVKSIPSNKMMLHVPAVGFLKESRTFAYYNLADGVTCTLSERKRAGTRFRADHTVMPKRPKAPPPELDAAKKADAPAPGLPGLPKLPGLGAPGLGGLPGLPGLPSLPGLPGLGGTAPSTGGAFPGLSGVPGLPAGLNLPKLGGLPGLGGMPGLPGIGDPKAMAAMMGGDLGKARPPLGMTMPGLDLGKAPGLGPPGMNEKIAAMMGKMGGLPGMSMSAPSLGLGKAPGALGGMPSFPDLSKGLPGLPPMPGFDPKAAMAKLGGLPGDLSTASSKGGGMPMTMPGLGGVPPGKAQAVGGMPPGLVGSSAKAVGPVS